MKFGKEFNSVERHGHKLMTVSNRFRFRAARRGLRSILVQACGEEGFASIYEFAMVLTVLLPLLVGIIYGGITLYDYVALDYAVAIGARTLASNRAVASATPNACGLGETALKQAAIGLNPNLITIDSGASQSETFVRNSNLTGDANPLSTCTALQPGDTVTMTATYPCNLTIPYARINLCSVPKGAVYTNVPSGITVTSTATGTCPSSNGCIAATATARIE